MKYRESMVDVDLLEHEMLDLERALELIHAAVAMSGASGKSQEDAHAHVAALWKSVTQRTRQTLSGVAAGAPRSSALLVARQELLEAGAASATEALQFEPNAFAPSAIEILARNFAEGKRHPLPRWLAYTSDQSCTCRGTKLPFVGNFPQQAVLINQYLLG
jgi:hypothetical protein